ncbi:PREDICTED: pollen-specific leucine-rich repeat extensin-like protein 3 [Camelina sativa]|uniref:Pollen-specific leucine-rich repeat extensin-like protein 3 n=1 Tax=Camelina sativa TaxID=90675 RepID=A0ABM0UY17_CAMSA|nr:PREDICTED: pollen-specific leucine-rich repeat extensin-like protein 3 [Camelina sativa]
MALSLTFHVLISVLVHLSLVSTEKHSHHHHASHTLHPHTPSPNQQLQQAYHALQAWKKVIYSDPKNLTADWVGPSVCSYTGIFCAPSPSDPNTLVVAGIDLNHGDIAGFLPEAIGLLSDLALIHLNSNRFCGILPSSLANLSLLYELDLSNNRFVGPFPDVVLSLPSLKYLDLRYNEFEGPLPPKLFSNPLDAIFVNNNRLTSLIPRDFTGTTASVVVFANNDFSGCLPPTIARFADTLEELLLINSSLSGCLPPEVGYLYKLRVLDVSYNSLVGPVPYSLAGLGHLEQLNLEHNMFTGTVPLGVCVLPSLLNLTFSYNYISEEEGICKNLTSRGIAVDDRYNCLPDKPLQWSQKVCDAVLDHPIDCYDHECSAMAPLVAPSTAGPSIAPGPSDT